MTISFVATVRHQEELFEVEVTAQCDFGNSEEPPTADFIFINRLDDDRSIEFDDLPSDQRFHLAQIALAEAFWAA